MLSFRQFVEGIVYGNEPKSKFDPRSKINEWDPHPHYAKHLSNHYLLSFIHKNSKDAREKSQASKELAIAEKKMAFWERHPLFDDKMKEDIHKRIKNVWKNK